MPACRKQNLCLCVLYLSVWIFNGCANATTGNGVVQISPASAVLLPGQSLQFNAVVKVPNPPQFLWQVNGVIGGSAATGTITTAGLYTSPSTPTSQPVQISIRDQVSSAAVAIYDPSHPAQGTVSATQNPLVAAYSILIPMGASVQILFGTDTTYGLSTSVASSANGETELIYVAGMLANTTYHMQAVVTLADGTRVKDADHTFATGTIPAGTLPNIST